MSENRQQHTPGPWKVHSTKQGHPYRIEDSAGKPITRWGCFMKPTSEESHANARLIAAAPDLYHPELAEWWTNGNVPVVPERIADLLDAYCVGVARAATGKGVEGE